MASSISLWQQIVTMKIQSVAESREVNAISGSLQKMSTAAVDERSSMEFLPPQPRPFCPEALQCYNIELLLFNKYSKYIIGIVLL